MLSDMSGHYLAMLGSCIVENPLNQVVAILVAGNINKWNSSAVTAALADAIKITTKKFSTPNLEAFLNNFGSELISAVLCCIPNNMVNGAAPVGRRTMLADVLNAPVSKLAVGHNVDVGKDFFDARSLKK